MDLFAKSEATNCLVQFFSPLIETQFGKTIKQIHSNNDKELALTQLSTGERVLFISIPVCNALNKIQLSKGSINICLMLHEHSFYNLRCQLVFGESAFKLRPS